MPRKAFPKPVVFTTRLMPNFLWHMLAVGKIGYDSDYADTWRHTVQPVDLARLELHRSHLAFREGQGGALSAFFAMLPGWLHIETKDDLGTYLASLDLVLRDRSLQPLADAFPQADWHDRFLSEDLRSMTFPDETELLRTIASELGSAYLHSFDRYVTDVWTVARPQLERRTAELSDFFSRRDYIAAWEQVFALPFAADRYEIVLCFANKNGPDYNSLGYGGNLIFFNKPFEKTCQFISHEIGTHLLIDTFFKLSVEPGIDFRRLYAAYETLAMFYNQQILGVEILAYHIPQFDDNRHLDLYRSVAGARVTPEEMLRRALID